MLWGKGVKKGSTERQSDWCKRSLQTAAQLQRTRSEKTHHPKQLHKNTSNKVTTRTKEQMWAGENRHSILKTDEQLRVDTQTEVTHARHRKAIRALESRRGTPKQRNARPIMAKRDKNGIRELGMGRPIKNNCKHSSAVKTVHWNSCNYTHHTSL